MNVEMFIGFVVGGVLVAVCMLLWEYIAGTCSDARWFNKSLRHDDPIEKADLEKRIKMLECEDHDWRYLINQFTQTGLNKECKNCGKTVGMDYKHWLEEQSKMHYKEHCKFANELYQQREEGSK